MFLYYSGKFIDAWGEVYLYIPFSDLSGEILGYDLVSAGSDGEFNEFYQDFPPVENDSFDYDIALCDGLFHYPPAVTGNRLSLVDGPATCW